MKNRMISFFRCNVMNTMPEMLLLLSWLAGLSLGFLTERLCGDAVVSFLELLPSQVPAWSGVLVSATLPLLISACAVILFHNIACYCCCLLRGCSQGILISAICRSFGFGAPIMVYLLLFSGLWVNLLLFWFWQRRLRLRDPVLLRDCCMALAGCLLVGIVDRLLIAPFLVDVIKLS